MARYTGLFVVAVNIDRLRMLLLETLQACNLDIIYDTGDYIMAREVPGAVPFTKLVTVEVLVDRSNTREDEARLNFVIKNEELPLHRDNHCRQTFDWLCETVASNRHWQLLETAAS